MSWIKIEYSLLSKPEVMAMAERFGVSEYEIAGHLVAFWCWVDCNLSLECPRSIGTKRGLDRVCGREGMVDALIEVGWLTYDGTHFSVPNLDRHLSKGAKQRGVEARKKQEQRKRPDSVPDLSRKCPDGAGTKTGLDKRREDKSNTNTEKPSRTANVFVAPSVSEVAEYVKEIGAVVDALDFVNYYTSNGWMVGRSKMKDWKAAVRTWNSKRLKPDDQYDEDPKFMRLLRIATQKGTSNECDVEWRRNNMSQEERDAVRVNCIRFETLADAKLHPLERKRIAKLYITTLRGMESLKNG